MIGPLIQIKKHGLYNQKFGFCIMLACIHVGCNCSHVQTPGTGQVPSGFGRLLSPCETHKRYYVFFWNCNALYESTNSMISFSYTVIQVWSSSIHFRRPPPPLLSHKPTIDRLRTVDGGTARSFRRPNGIEEDRLVTRKTGNGWIHKMERGQSSYWVAAEAPEVLPVQEVSHRWHL